jgi:uncharacterized protein YdaU (DUF1376 family)
VLDERSKAMYQPWDQEQFNADIRVRKMTSMQRWVYKTLLQEAFVCSCRPDLPDDDEVLWMLADCEDLEDWLVYKPAVIKMFEKEEVDGKKILFHRRLRKDWDRLLAKREAKSEGGRKAAEAKRSKKEQPVSTTQQNVAERSTTEENSVISTKGSEVSEVSEVKRSEEKEEIPAEPIFEEDEDTDMNPVREIPRISQRILGIEPRVWPSETTRLKELTALHGGTAVTNKFQEWAEDHVGEVGKPVQEFLLVASAMLTDTFTPAVSKAATGIVRELAYLSGGKVAFDERQKAKIGKALTEFQEMDVVAAFRNFIEGLKTDQDWAFAAKNFSEKADQLAFTAEKERTKRASDQVATDHAREILEAEAEKERLARKARREAENAEVEDSLGDPD